MDDMGATTVKKMIYTNKIDDEIIFHENNMLTLYLEEIKKYIPLFQKKGYSVKVGLMGKYFCGDTVGCLRERFQNGYQCYVYCVIQKDGNEVHIGSVDGEADYYSLSSSWIITSIFRSFFKLNVELYEKADGVNSDLKNFWLQLKKSRRI